MDKLKYSLEIGMKKPQPKCTDPQKLDQETQLLGVF